MLRSALVVLGGFVVLALIVGVTTPIAIRFLLPAHPAGVRPVLTSTYLATNLLCATGAALLGGWLVARFAASSPLGHASALAALMFLMSLLSMKQASGTGQPRWYALVLACLMPLVVLLGAWLRTRYSTPHVTP